MAADRKKIKSVRSRWRLNTSSKRFLYPLLTSKAEYAGSIPVIGSTLNCANADRSVRLLRLSEVLSRMYSGLEWLPFDEVKSEHLGVGGLLADFLDHDRQIRFASSGY